MEYSAKNNKKYSKRSKCTIHEEAIQLQKCKLFIKKATYSQLPLLVPLSSSIESTLRVRSFIIKGFTINSLRINTDIVIIYKRVAFQLQLGV